MAIRQRFFFVLLPLLMCFTSFNSAGQNPALFENGASYINSVNGPGYFRPLANLLNNTFHSSIFPASDYSDGFYFYIGGNVSYNYIPEKSWHFEGITAFPIEPEKELVVPTVFGPNQSEALQSSTGEYYLFPGGFEMNSVLLGVPQISLGGFANTAITLRFLAIPLDDEWGELRLFGIAAQHIISPYLNLEKMDLSVEFAVHRFGLGDWLSSSHIMARGSAAKAFERSRIYGFLGYQNGKLELTNSVEEEVVRSVSDNTVFIGAGASIDLAIFNVNLEVLVNSLITINAGVGLKF